MSITRLAFSVAHILAIAAPPSGRRRGAPRARCRRASRPRGRSAARRCRSARRHLAELGLRELEVRQRLAEHLARLAHAAIASASARRAMPSAAAATEARKMSSVRIASLKPPSRSPSSCAARHRAAVEAQRRERMRRHHLDVLGEASSRACSASTMKALMPARAGGRIGLARTRSRSRRCRRC